MTAAMWQTLIGAAAAIVGALVGGFFGAWWQIRHGVALARNIRREERREAGLFAWNAKVVEVIDGIDRAYRCAEHDPAACPTAWADIHGQIEGLRTTWEGGVSGQIPDQSVLTKYLDVRAQAHNCVSRFGVPTDPPVITGTTQDLVRDAGRLLMLLGELGKDLARTIDGLREAP
jgi:hypothetical protein